MFGVVPRVLWSKIAPADERGRIELAHNCLLLTRVDDPKIKVVIEVGSGDKFDAKTRDIFGLAEYSIADALREANVAPKDIAHAIVSHLHFDHAGGLTRRSGKSRRPGTEVPASVVAQATDFDVTFPGAPVYVQRREWDDANANNSVMTRTYLRENLEPIRERVMMLDAPPPFPRGYVPARDESPPSPLIDRIAEIVPGIFGFIVPGHTWGQQALMFTDDRDRTVVFTPDIMPTANHVGAAYNMAYDVEPFVSTVTRRWFLAEAVKNDWLLVLDHEPGNPVRKARPDGKGWFQLIDAAS
jgi:glyoxylase-like metal-dependent hydrolase (beta-lactamase superfamily II)